MSKVNTKIGSYTGTGAAITNSIGFVPDHIIIYNATDGDERWEWFAGMADASALWSRSVTDNATTGNASMSLITTNGVSAYNGSLSAAKGFTIGTALSENGKTFRFKATRNAD